MSCAGIVVGGPYAGRWLEFPDARFLVETSDPLPWNPGKAGPTVTIHRTVYKFSETMGLKFWHPEDQGPADWLAELLAGYHPPVFKR